LLLLEIDTDPGFITSGAAYTQSSGATFAASQGYAVGLAGLFLSDGSVSAEVDDTAEFTANSNGTVTGILDENFAPDGEPNPDLAFVTSGSSYGSIDANGRYGFSAAVGSGNNTTLNGGLDLVFYAVDGTTFPFIEVDEGQVATGVLIEQNSGSSSSISKPTGLSHMFVVHPLVTPRATIHKKKTDH
jgi:hypothetical protein